MLIDDGGQASVGVYTGRTDFVAAPDGTLEVSCNPSRAFTRIAAISGFSLTGTTTLIVDGAAGDTVKYVGNANSGHLNLYSDGKEIKYYATFNGDYLNAAFNATTDGNNLVNRASNVSNVATAAASHSAASLVQAAASFGAETSAASSPRQPSTTRKASRA